MSLAAPAAGRPEQSLSHDHLFSCGKMQVLGIEIETQRGFVTSFFWSGPKRKEQILAGIHQNKIANSK